MNEAVPASDSLGLDFADLAAAGGGEPEELAGQLLAVGVQGHESFLDELRLAAGLLRGVVGADLVAFRRPENESLHI